MKNIVLIFILLALVSCSSNTPNISNDPTKPIVIENNYSSCPRPIKPEMIPLKEDQHIGSKDNIFILLENVSNMKMYMDLQNATIDCYEAQTK